MDSDVNSWGKGLKVVKDERDSTNAPRRSLNPFLAVPATLCVEVDKGLQDGDTIKIYRKPSNIPIINADYNIRIERNEASSTDSN
ncbi:hypothetical protein P3S67_000337 [Capsicum chacoense]